MKILLFLTFLVGAVGISACNDDSLESLGHNTVSYNHNSGALNCPTADQQILRFDSDDTNGQTDDITCLWHCAYWDLTPATLNTAHHIELYFDVPWPGESDGSWSPLGSNIQPCD